MSQFYSLLNPQPACKKTNPVLFWATGKPEMTGWVELLHNHDSVSQDELREGEAGARKRSQEGFKVKTLI